MNNKFEKEYLTPVEGRKQFRKSLTEKILELTVPKIVENTRGREVTTKDMAEVMNPLMEQYRDSDMTRKMTGTTDFREWDFFSEEIAKIVFDKVQETKQKIEAGKTTPLKSQDLKQKELF